MATLSAVPAGVRAEAATGRVRTWLWTLASVRWAAAALALFLVGLAAQLAGAPDAVWWTLYLSCYLAGGWEPLLEGLRALRGRTLDVDLLMVVAAVGAAAIGQVFDGALLIVIFATSGALENVATTRTERSVRALLDLTPQVATRIDVDGGEKLVPAEELVTGDVIVVRPGERISADGRVVDGASEVDQSSITGEPLAVPKHTGDEVFAGTLNGTGMLRIVVTHDPSDTVVARIVAMVGAASATKARTQLFIEKVEQRYSAAVVAATIGLFTVPLLFGADVQSALLRAMTFMIVASPCAVVLATMPPLLSAIATASRHGVLVKSAVVMERLADTAAVVFDKTGTLTTGAPQVTRVLSASIHVDEVLGTAAAAEQFSEHPLGRAVVRAARDRGVPIPGATGFTALPGRGVRAEVVGSVVEVCSPAAYPGVGLVDEIEGRGATAVVVVRDGVVLGALGLDDRIRDDAAATVQRLDGLSPVVLTGDNARAAARLGSELGMDDVRAGLLPEQKAAAVQELQRDGRPVLMVGDGINDAPAMAVAHTAIAMGRSGADLTLDTADAVSIRDELDTIPTLLALAQRARRTVIVNLAVAATFITGLVAWDLFGELPLPLGVAGHEGSTVLVALNGLRLLGDRAWRRASRA